MKLKALLFFFFIYAISFAQYKQLLHKPYKDKAEDLPVLYENVMKMDSVSAFAYLSRFQDWASQNNDIELVLEAQLIRAQYCRRYLSENPENFHYLLDVVKNGKKENILHIEERGIQLIAIYYWMRKEYERAFEWFMQSAEVLKKMDPDRFPNMAKHLNLIGRSYYYFKDYDNALVYYKKASALKKNKFNAKAILGAQNSLGLCYQKLGQLDRAKKWFLKIIDDTSHHKSKVWKNIASGNLGFHYYLLDDYDKAIPLFRRDISGGLEINDHGLAAGSTIPLGDIYLQKGQLEKSRKKIEEAKWYIHKSGQTERLRKLYPVMSKWYAVNNQPDSSAVYLDSSIVANRNYDKKYSSLKLLLVNQKVAAKDREIQIKKLETAGQIQVSKRNTIIFIIGLLLGGSVIAYWFRNKYHLNKQKVKELELQHTKNELVNAKEKLTDLTLRVKKENSRITELAKGDSSESNQAQLSNLRSKNILTKEDWVEYKGLFDEVHPNIIKKLNAFTPKLTPAEKRCLCLEKLQMSNSEMALLLGVSDNAIRVTKHRIRKKLDLPKNQSLRKMMESL